MNELMEQGENLTVSLKASQDILNRAEISPKVVLHAETKGQIALASVPFIGRLGTITVHGSAAAPVDTYRSLVGDNSP